VGKAENFPKILGQGQSQVLSTVFGFQFSVFGKNKEKIIHDLYCLLIVAGAELQISLKAITG